MIAINLNKMSIYIGKNVSNIDAYSKLKQLWRHSDILIKYHFPCFAYTVGYDFLIEQNSIQEETWKLYGVK